MGNNPSAITNDNKELREKQALFRVKLVRDKEEKRLRREQEEARKEHLDEFISDFNQIIVEPVTEIFKEWTGNDWKSDDVGPITKTDRSCGVGTFKSGSSVSSKGSSSARSSKISHSGSSTARSPKSIHSGSSSARSSKTSHSGSSSAGSSRVSNSGSSSSSQYSS